MTVPSSVNRSGPYSGNGVATVFDYDFRIVSATHLTVVRTIDGVDTIVNPSDYAVTGVGADNGTIVFSLAPATGQAITIIRNVPFTQETDLENQGAYYAETVEAAFDLAVMRDQQLEERLDRAVQIPVGADPSTLPGLIENVLRLADSVDNIDTVADNIDAVNEVAPHAATITANVGEIVTVAENIADVLTVSNNIASVNEVAPYAQTITENLEDITNFADVYQGPKATDPALRNDGSALQPGDLYFNTASKLMRVYDGTAWRDAAAQSLNITTKSFVGNGAQTAFVLDVSPGVPQNLLVEVGGVLQVPNVDYTVSGATVTMGTAPGAGVAVNTWVIATVSGLNIPADGSVTVPKLAAEVATRLIEFDIRDSRFAGGAKWNDIDDDSAAFNAAIAYFKTLGGINQYQGANAARLRLPRGVGRVGSSVDLSGAHNVHIVGEGDGVTTVRLTANTPAFKTTTVAGNDDFRIGLADFCIFGPGRANANAHGVDFGALNNGFIRDVRFFALRDAIRLRNNWQTDLTRIKIDGGPTVGGALTCYRGICLLDGLTAGGASNSVIENAVKIYGGIISAVETVGFRGESVSGSMVTGLEVLGAGQTGVLIGDNPGGKPVKWFTWTGGMIDTCPDLLAIIRGASSECTQMHFSGVWLGYASAGGGNGDAVRIEDASKITVRPDIVANVDTALVAVRCTGIIYQAGVIDGYDRSLVGSTGIILEDTVQSHVSVGRANKWTGSPSSLLLAETGTSNNNVLEGINADNTMTVIGSGTVVNGCRPFKSRNHGGVDMLSGSSTVVVTHGLGRMPERGEIQVTPRSTLATSGVNSFAVDTITATQFTIRTNANVTANTAFDWFADVSRG